MSGISINPSDYLGNYNHWDMLVKYLEDNSARYHYDTAFSLEQTLGLLKSMISEAYKGVITDDGYNPGNLLDRALTGLASAEILTLSRDNVLRLILALGINNKGNKSANTSLQEANNFLLTYMHESELSPRNLRECIFIWTVHNNMSTKDIVDMIRHHSEEIKKQPICPTGDDFYEGGTEDILNLLDEIKLLPQFEQFIRTFRTFFTKLGNTQYCSLFSDICIFPVTRKGTDTFMMVESDPDENDSDQLIPSFLRPRAQSDRLQRERYYKRLFGIYSLDEETYNNHLDSSTINRLTKLLPDVFLTESRFTNLLRRANGSEVPYGVHLLHMLIDMPFETYVPVRIVKKNPRTEEVITSDPAGIFKEACDYYLNNVGFASMNPAVPIDKLVLDIYRLTASSKGDVIYKDLFLYNFREALKIIANTAKE